MPKSAVSRLEDHLGYWLRFVSNHVTHAFTQKVEARGVTVAEWVLLRELYQSENARPGDLSGALGLTRGTVSKLVERLLGKGLLTRTKRADDRRSQVIELTRKGRKLVPELAALADRNDEEFFGHLTTDQKSVLTECLQDMVRRHGWKDLPID